MSSKVRPFGRKSGFTLVELLIVIAIIGVLSTIGIPTFRRMIQKSKKTEAQVALGGIYTAEQGFLGEYGTYGNNLSRMGYQTDGAATNLTYIVGFFNGSTSCAGTVTSAGANILPTSASGAGAALNASFPAYFTVNMTGAYQSGSSVGYAVNANCLAVTNNNIYNAAGNAYSQFTAAAEGVVAPGLDKSNTSGASGNLDVWTISETKLLANTQDGVK